MSSKFKTLLRNLENYIKGRNYKVFLVFVFISTLFWLLIKFSKQYTVIDHFSVNYISIPEKLSWGEMEEHTLELSVLANGFQQLNYAFGGKDVDLDMSKVKRYSEGKYYLLPQEQLGKIIKQFPSTVSITYQNVDTLFFDFSKKVNKKVPIKLVDSLELAKSYNYMYPVFLKPDSVVVTGPLSIVKDIEFVETYKIIKTDIRKSCVSTVNLKKNKDDRILFSTNSVDVNINVERYTQNTMIVPVVLENVPQGFMLKIFPDNVKIIYNTGLSNFESIKPASFEIVADYNKLKDGHVQFIPLDVNVLSKKIDLIRVEPSDVEFLLRKIDN